MMNTPTKQAIYTDGAATYQQDATQAFDFPSLDELDPSLVDGFQLFYEREVPFELRSSASVDHPTEVGALEAIRAKILVRGQPGRLEAIRVELSSETNLFFHYVHDMDAAKFAVLQDSQRLMVAFQDYPAVLLRMLNQCIKEPHIYLAVYVMQITGEARLDFIQNMEYKFVELLSCMFKASPEDVVRAQIAFRYNLIKSRLALMSARLSDVNHLVKIKSPSLLLQLQKSPSKFGMAPLGGGQQTGSKTPFK